MIYVGLIKMKQYIVFYEMHKDRVIVTDVMYSASDFEKRLVNRN